MTIDQQGYTYSSAATIAVNRLERGIKRGTKEYKRAYDSYLKSFYYYGQRHPRLLVDEKRLSNSFVESMISYWRSCGEEDKIKLTQDQIREIMENTPAFIAKTRMVYSQIKAAQLLKVDRQTIIHWMNQGLMKYILIGGDRKPLKQQVDKMVPFYSRKRGKYDSTIYRDYFQQKGLIPQPEGRKKSKKVMTYDDLVAKCSDLKTRVSELEKTIKATEKALKKSEKLVDNSASQLQDTRQKYQATVAENKAAQKRITYLETRVERLKTRHEHHDNLKKEKDHLSRQLAAANKNIKDLDAQIIRLQGQYDDTIEGNNTLSIQLTEQKEKTRILETRIGELKREKRDLQQQYDEALKKKNQVTANQLHEAKKEESSQQEISSLEVTITELKQKNQKLQEEISDIARKNDELMAKNAAYKTILKQKEDVTQTPEYKALKQQVDKLSAQLAELKTSYDALSTQNKSLQKQIQTSKQRGKQKARIYYPSETYEVGERIEHTIFEAIGKVVSVSGNTMEVLFEGSIGKRELSQGKRLCEP